MATVTGNLKDITGGTFGSREGVIQFTLNAGNIRVGSGNVIPDNTREVVPDFDTGAFSINLEPTDAMALDAWYTVSVLWLQQSDSGIREPAALASYVDLKIRVPSSGGQIGDLWESGSGNGGSPGPNSRVVWVSQTAPANPNRFMLWLEQEPGPSPDPFDPRNTSDLKEWQ
ncbi:hypothetical protein NMP99_03105 [Glutamicibacter mishrai]|uniref:hypothetical protein n=1 Tax=Glutamicibacter mishrai TaxID=1775880 RepID=UPI0020CF03C5|nr:hypothetical protein [Glutamicibacter mishrai]UTT40260.1 hypothetical protein NMP99_02815 [Glutamicibacter mishrai]UTT40311.1 hypothetical protein NMP99_03105 [Glutamicibacter mishrai]